MKLSPIEAAQHHEGQLAFLLICMRAVLIAHPQRDAATATIHADHEALFAHMLDRPTPQPFLDGLQQAFSAVLNQPNDLEQTPRR